MRHIDADELIKKIYPMGMGDGMYVINAKAVKFAIDKTPTADVVPKSELEASEKEIKRLQSILNNYALRYGTVRDQRAVIDNAKAEVAREIFEEIESIIRKHDERPKYQLMLDLAELKKKYTEGEG